MSRTTERAETTPAAPVLRVTTFRACEWPAPSYANTDGYDEIVATEYRAEGRTEVSGASAPELFRSRCAELQLTYTFQKQGPASTTSPLHVTAGSIVDVFGKPWPPPGMDATLPFTPGTGDTVVVHNLSYAIARARCLR